MVFQRSCVLVLWTNVASTLEGLKYGTVVREKEIQCCLYQSPLVRQDSMVQLYGRKRYNVVYLTAPSKTGQYGTVAREREIQCCLYQSHLVRQDSMVQ